MARSARRKGLWRDTRGGVAIMSAAGGGLACLCAGMTIDLASVALQARRLQGAADLAALSAAHDLARAQAVGLATAADNADGPVHALIEPGVYVADAELAPDDRFAAGEDDANAVRVTVTGSAPLYFGRMIIGRDHMTLTRTATAARPAAPPMAALTIGSRLASLNGGLLNQILGGLTGSTVSLSLMDYRALADADISLLSFVDGLATELDVTAGDYDALLRHDIDAGRAISVLETLAGGQAGSALDRLSRAADGLTVRVGELIGLETRAPQALQLALGAEVSALELAQTVIEVGGGARQVRLDAGAQTGLAATDLWLAIGERPNNAPWLTVTDRGQPVIRTAQARLYVEARTSSKLSGLAQVTVPVLVELAASEASLTRIECAQGARRVHVATRPGVARLRLARIDRSKLDDFRTELTAGAASLVSVAGLVTVSASADVELADRDSQSLVFGEADITAARVKTARARGALDGAITSLFSRLDVTVNVIGLGLGLGDLVGGLGALLTPIGPVLDGVVNSVLRLAGLGLGEADVAVRGASCPDARAGLPRLVG